MNTKFTFEVLALAGIAAGLAVTSGCKTAYSNGNDLSLRPLPESLAPEAAGEVTYATPDSEKPLPYWQQNPEAVSALDNVAAAKAAGKYGCYTVKSGDTLSKIAAAHGMRTADLVAVNPGLNANKIQVGQTIVLPSGTAGRTTGVTSPAPASSTVAAGGTYVVKKGDILGRIANQHGVKLADLKKANNLTGDKIMVGQKLVIPGKGAVTAPVAATPVTPAKSAAPAVTVKAKPAEAKPVAAKPVAVKPVEVKAQVVVPESLPEVKSDLVVDDIAAPVVVPVETAPAVATPPAGTHTYTVKPGQDLFDVAVQWGVSSDDIKNANNLTSGEVQPGQVLNIPNAAAPKAQ